MKLPTIQPSKKVELKPGLRHGPGADMSAYLNQHPYEKFIASDRASHKASLKEQKARLSFHALMSFNMDDDLEKTNSLIAKLKNTQNILHGSPKYRTSRPS
jgi:O-acetylhomoserine/O-acetylserine sulfhydrylase-like pyridoxal-dependent enzyme